MKKVLFASTALVMTAGVASAEVTLSGSAKMGVTYNGTTTSVYSDYGLAAGLWSQDIDRIMRVTRRLRSGQVFVNNWADMDQTVPFGGVKQSGNGRDKSHHSLEEYSDLKTVWMTLAT